MQRLTDYIKANTLGHNRTFCIDRRIARDVRSALQLAGIRFTCWGWYPGIPQELETQFDKEPKRGYALFTGPFTEESIERIAELAPGDSAVFALEQEEFDTAAENAESYAAHRENEDTDGWDPYAGNPAFYPHCNMSDIIELAIFNQMRDIILWADGKHPLQKGDRLYISSEDFHGPVGAGICWDESGERLVHMEAYRSIVVLQRSQENEFGFIWLDAYPDIKAASAKPTGLDLLPYMKQTEAYRNACGPTEL